MATQAIPSVVSAPRQLLECARTTDKAVLVLVPGPGADDCCFVETAIRMMRRASHPVLALAPSQTQRPRCAVAAIDFSAESLNAARVALDLLQSGGTLYLAHVQPDFTSARADSLNLAGTYRRGIDGAFETVIRDLEPLAAVRIVPVVLDGSRVAELTRFADRVGADMLALGAANSQISATNGVSRLTTALLRERRFSVLSAPARRARFDERA